MCWKWHQMSALAERSGRGEVKPSPFRAVMKTDARAFTQGARGKPQLLEPPGADPHAGWRGRGEQVTAPPIPIVQSTGPAVARYSGSGEPDSALPFRVAHDGALWPRPLHSCSCRLWNIAGSLESMAATAHAWADVRIFFDDCRRSQRTGLRTGIAKHIESDGCSCRSRVIRIAAIR